MQNFESNINIKGNFSQLQQEIIDTGLCVRCGICAGVCPIQVIGFDSHSYPQLIGKCVVCNLCNVCCPGGDIDFPALSKQVFNTDYNPTDLLGHIENMYVAYSKKNSVRNAGTSGGVITGLLLYLLEKKKIEGVIVVGWNKEKPWLTKGILATNREEVIAAAKSKYQITPSMEVLQLLRKSKGRYAVVGLPCQIHGLRKLEKADPSLFGKIYCILGLFCANNMERSAVSDLIKIKGIERTDVAQFDFRGGDWPGGFQITKNNDKIVSLNSKHFTSMINVMFRLYGAKRCNLCIDACAEYADLSFGDFWANDYYDNLSEFKQSTLVFQRTQVGTEILKEVENNNALFIHVLPEKRVSNRTLNMAREKKQKAKARLYYKSKQDEAIPNFHFQIQEPSFHAKKHVFIFRFYNLLRKTGLKMLILKLSFSSFGRVFDYFNLIRKKWFYNFHHN